MERTKLKEKVKKKLLERRRGRPHLKAISRWDFNLFACKRVTMSVDNKNENLIKNRLKAFCFSFSRLENS